MTLSEMDSKARTRFATDEERWEAVLRRDGSADGEFVFAVRTTGVYCRPSCAARRALRGNVEFFSGAAEAERAGFRACLRCRPNRLSANPEHEDAVARACAMLAAPGDEPGLEALARAVGMSPWHFHRVFKALVGMTPKAYATAKRAQRVRAALRRGGSVTTALYGAGFGSSGRFYARATAALGMTPVDYREGGAGARILYAIGACSLGLVLVAATRRGVCAIALGDEADALTAEFKEQFSRAELIPGDGAFQELVGRVVAFVDHPAEGLDLPLEVRGTAFQHRVWAALREIPCGVTQSYGELADKLGARDATRAVAGACAANPVAVAIPCHRVVRRDESASGYRWGVERKAKLLARERRRK